MPSFARTLLRRCGPPERSLESSNEILGDGLNHQTAIFLNETDDGALFDSKAAAQLGRDDNLPLRGDNADIAGQLLDSYPSDNVQLYQYGCTLSIVGVQNI
jgi:hypothetical protein